MYTDSMGTPVTVLIVDDEIPILENLRLFPWEKHGYKLVGEAQNGEEALSLCGQYRPDIVLTDIVMPILDGLELVESIHREWPRMQVILLSVYKEFEYARKAIHLGVNEYLIKGVYRDEDLLRALERTKAELVRERIHSALDMEKRHSTAAERICRCLDGKETLEAEEATFWGEYPFRLAVLFLRNLVTPNTTLRENLFSWMRKISEHFGFTFAYLNDHQIHIYLPRLSDSEAHRILSGVLSAFRNAQPGQGIAVCGLIGPEVDSFSAYRDAYRMIRTKKNNGFYVHDYHLIPLTHREFVPLGIREQMIHTKQVKEQVRNGISPLSYLQNTFIPEMIEANTDPEDVKLLATSWLKEYEHTQQDAEHLIRSDSIFILIETLNDLFAFAREDKQERRFEIRKAMMIMKDRIGEDITITEIASEVSLSPNYFGELFKKHTGISFKEYVTQIRLEHAYHLIETSSLKVYEVAERSGFHNYRYFTSSFKRFFGRTPTSIRSKRTADVHVAADSSYEDS